MYRLRRVRRWSSGCLNRLAAVGIQNQIAMEETVNQADVLATIKPPTIRHQIDELIQPFMAEHGLGHYSAATVDALWGSSDYMEDGRLTGEGMWRALRKFAEEVRAL